MSTDEKIKLFVESYNTQVRKKSAPTACNELLVHEACMLNQKPPCKTCMGVMSLLASALQ